MSGCPGIQPVRNKDSSNCWAGRSSEKCGGGGGGGGDGEKNSNRGQVASVCVAEKVFLGPKIWGGGGLANPSLAPPALLILRGYINSLTRAFSECCILIVIFFKIDGNTIYFDLTCSL